MANQIKLDLQGRTVPQKIQFLRDLVTQLTGNANFTTPSPALSVITTKANALETALSDQQTAQQAALGAFATLGRLSLMDYLK